MGINLADLADYCGNVDQLPNAADFPEFPAPKPSELRFPKPNSRELLEREEHVDDHLPPMHPEWEGTCTEQYLPGQTGMRMWSLKASCLF